MPVTPEYLAADLAVDPADVRVLVAGMVDLHDEDIPDHIAGEVRSILDPHGERTAPAALYWPGHPAELPDPDAPQRLTGDPTAGEGLYPPLEEL